MGAGSASPRPGGGGGKRWALGGGLCAATCPPRVEGEWAGKRPGVGGARRPEWVFRPRQFRRKIPASGQGLRAPRAAGGTRRWMVLEAGAGARAESPARCCCTRAARAGQVRTVNVSAVSVPEEESLELCPSFLCFSESRGPIAPLHPSDPSLADWLELAGRPDRGRRLRGGAPVRSPAEAAARPLGPVLPGVWGSREPLHQSPFTPLGSFPFPAWLGFILLLVVPDYEIDYTRVPSSSPRLGRFILIVTLFGNSGFCSLPLFIISTVSHRDFSLNGIICVAYQYRI